MYPGYDPTIIAEFRLQVGEVLASWNFSFSQGTEQMRMEPERMFLVQPLAGE
jgi:hypothetical protein